MGNISIATENDILGKDIHTKEGYRKRASLTEKLGTGM